MESQQNEGKSHMAGTSGIWIAPMSVTGVGWIFFKEQHMGSPSLAGVECFQAAFKGNGESRV